MTQPDSPDPRAAARADFLALTGQQAATLEALPVDASFRRYFRLRGTARPMLLMDAPPPREDVRPFVRIGRHLAGLGLSPPAIYEVDEERGFLLLEDFGEATFTRLLNAGAAEEPLFRSATDVLVVLHTHPRGAHVTAPPFDQAKLLEEASELTEWYGLAATGVPTPADAVAAFLDAWRALLESLPPVENGLVLLDYHVDNLMQLSGREGAKAAGLLDFQDARIGPKAYDLLCLLRNERRGIDPAVATALYDHYIASARPTDPQAFGLWYRALAAQRYTKVLGRFARLTLRDGRNGYLRYMPRVAMLLDQAMDGEPALAPVRTVLQSILPNWRTVPPDDPEGVRRKVASAARGP